jgi:hypothetical protein
MNIITIYKQIKCFVWPLLVILFALAFAFEFYTNKQTETLLINNFDKIHNCTNDPRHKVWLVSYAEGEVYKVQRNWQTFSAINKCIDFYLPYTFRDLDEDFVRRNKELLSQPRGAGYWVWKPYVILKALNMIPEGDIVLYLDGEAFVQKPIDDLVSKYLEFADIALTKTSFLNKMYVKRDLLRAFNMDNEYIRNLDQFESGYILLRNTDFAKQFVASWLSWSENANLIDDSPSSGEYKEFIDHRHDQAILTLLFFSYEHDKDSKKLTWIDSSKIEQWDVTKKLYSGYYFINPKKRDLRTTNFEIFLHMLQTR